MNSSGDLERKKNKEIIIKEVVDEWICTQDNLFFVFGINLVCGCFFNLIKSILYWWNVDND